MKMADLTEVDRKIEEFAKTYLEPNPWIKTGQKVRHKTREIYGTLGFVGKMNVEVTQLDIREDRKENLFLEMTLRYKASLFELATLWEPHDPSEDGDRFDRIRRDP